MALILDSTTPHKARTGPNPQQAGDLGAALGYQAVTGTGRAGVNQAVTAAGTAQPPKPAGATVPGGQVTYDYSNDPALQLITGQQQMVVAQAQQQALAAQKQALIAYGDPGLAMAVLGDQGTALAAGGNPASTLATLAAGNQKNVRDINEAENKNNLFFSSDRGYQLGLAQQSYLQQQGKAAGDLQSSLGDIGTKLLAAEQSAYNTETQAQIAAYNRAVKNPIGITAPPSPLARSVTANPTGATTVPGRGVTTIH